MSTPAMSGPFPGEGLLVQSLNSFLPSDDLSLYWPAGGVGRNEGSEAGLREEAGPEGRAKSRREACGWQGWGLACKSSMQTPWARARWPGVEPLAPGPQDGTEEQSPCRTT